jgi:hypothetical protein
VAQQFLPKPPDPEMLDPQSGKFDMVTYQMQKEAYERNSSSIMQMIQQHQNTVAQQNQDLKRAEQELRAAEAEQLFEKMPQIASTEKYQVWYADAAATAGEFGVTPEELDAVTDHRMYLILNEAMQFRKLKAKVASAKQKVSGKPAVMSGSTRKTEEQNNSYTAKKAMERLEKTGSFDDGVQALLALEKARR